MYTFFIQSNGTYDAYTYTDIGGAQSLMASGKVFVGRSSLLHITVMVVGFNFTFYINDQFVGHAYNTAYHTGTVGIAVDAGGNVLVKSFSLSAAT